MATCYLVKEVLDEHWSVKPTALRLRVLVGDDLGLLCQLRALAAGVFSAPDRTDETGPSNARRRADRKS